MNSIHDSKRALTQDYLKMDVKDAEEIYESRTSVQRRFSCRTCPITHTKNAVIFLIIHQIVSLILTTNVSGNATDNIYIYIYIPLYI